MAANLLDRVAGHSNDTVATAVAASGDLWHAVADALTGDAPGEQVLAAVRRGAAEWALEGIPLDVLHHIVFECGRAAIDMFTSNTPAAVGPEQGADMSTRCLRIVEVLDVLSHTVAESYLAESGRTETDAKRNGHDLTEALLSGAGFNAVARHRGVTWLDAMPCSPSPPITGRSNKNCDSSAMKSRPGAARPAHWLDST